MATIAELAVRISADIANFERGLDRTEAQLDQFGLRANRTGLLVAGGLAAAAAAVGAFGVSSIDAAVDFERTMTNVATVTGATAAQLEAMSAQVREIGRTSTFGSQAVAEAFYDVVGGVTDASARMSVLNASVRLAEAGQADLSASTKGMIAAINAYTPAVLAADRAADIYTRTVGMGVGTMDEFVAAMNPLAGLSAQVSNDFADLGAQIAFMTTKGFSASAAATNVQSAITALLAPSSKLKNIYAQLGITSGQAALEQYGLVGTLNMINDALGGNTGALTEALGRVEALKAAIVLTGEEYSEFKETFDEGLEGAALTAQERQMQSVGAQWDLLTAKINDYKIGLGSLALPVVTEGLGALDMIFKIGSAIVDPDSVAAAQASVQDQVSKTPISGVEMPVTTTYIIESGDTVETIMEKTGKSREQVTAALTAANAYQQIPVSYTVSDISAILGISPDRVVQIFNDFADANIPTTVPRDFVLQFMQAHPEMGNLKPEEIEAQAQAAYNAQIGEQKIAGRISVTPEMILSLAEAGDVPWDTAQSWLQGLADQQQFTTKLKAGTEITFVPTEDELENFRTQMQAERMRLEQDARDNPLPPVALKLPYRIFLGAMITADELFGTGMSDAEIQATAANIQKSVDELGVGGTIAAIFEQQLEVAGDKISNAATGMWLRVKLAMLQGLQDLLDSVAGTGSDFLNELSEFAGVDLNFLDNIDLSDEIADVQAELDAMHPPQIPVEPVLVAASSRQAAREWSAIDPVALPARPDFSGYTDAGMDPIPVSVFPEFVVPRAEHNFFAETARLAETQASISAGQFGAAAGGLGDLGMFGAQVSPEALSQIQQVQAGLEQAVAYAASNKIDLQLAKPSIARDVNRDLDHASRDRSMNLSVAIVLAGMTATMGAIRENVEGQIPIRGYASGGQYPVNEPILVGEKGPEIIMPGRTGTVIPNANLSASGSGGMAISGGNFYFYGVSNTEEFYNQMLEADKQRAKPAFAN